MYGSGLMIIVIDFKSEILMYKNMDMFSRSKDFDYNKKYWRTPRGVLASRVCARKNPKSPPLHLQQMLTPNKSPPQKN